MTSSAATQQNLPNTSELMEAVDSIKKGDASSLKKILNRVEPRAENWINQEIKTEGGKTLLLIAIGNEVMDCVDALIEAGADLNLYNEKNKTSPIELAFKMRSLRMVKALVRHGVDVKKGNPNIQRA